MENNGADSKGQAISWFVYRKLKMFVLIPLESPAPALEYHQLCVLGMELGHRSFYSILAGNAAMVR